MGKHGADDQPRAGRKTKGKPIGKAEVKVQSSTGVWLWKQTAKLWGGGKKK